MRLNSLRVFLFFFVAFFSELGRKTSQLWQACQWFMVNVYWSTPVKIIMWYSCDKVTEHVQPVKVIGGEKVELRVWQTTQICYVSKIPSTRLPVAFASQNAVHKMFECLVKQAQIITLHTWSKLTFHKDWGGHFFPCNVPLHSMDSQHFMWLKLKVKRCLAFLTWTWFHKYAEMSFSISSDSPL